LNPKKSCRSETAKVPITVVRKATNEGRGREPAWEEVLAHTAAGLMRGRLKRAFLEAIATLNGNVDLRALAEAMAVGDADQALRIVGVDQNFARLLEGKGVETNFREAVQQTYAAATKAAVAQLPSKVALDLSFDLMNPEAVNFLQSYSFDLIQQISEETRASIRQVILRAFREGGHPFQQAREIRNSIGLTRHQERAVANYRAALENNTSIALQRELRDHRFDPAVRGAINVGRPLDQARINKLVDRYRERYINHRATTIARTETNRASNKGQRAVWRQAQNQGLLEPKTTERVWIVSGDPDTCEDCLAYAGDTVGLNDEFPEGDPPLHPNCRCNTALQFNVEKRELAITKRIWVWKYSPEQPRDEHGRWAGDGGVAAAGPALAPGGRKDIAEVIEASEQDRQRGLEAIKGDYVEGTRPYDAYMCSQFALKNRGLQTLIGRDAEGKLLGVISLSRKAEPGKLWVPWLGVNPHILTGEIQAKGTGTRMMTEVAKIAAKDGLGIGLDSLDENSDKFYRALGMTPSGERGPRGLSFSWTPAQVKAVAEHGISKVDEDFNAIAALLRAREVEEREGPPLAGQLDSVRKYSPDQPRDEHGRWTSTGGAAAPGARKPESWLQGLRRAPRLAAGEPFVSKLPRGDFARQHAEAVIQEGREFLQKNVPGFEEISQRALAARNRVDELEDAKHQAAEEADKRRDQLREGGWQTQERYNEAVDKLDQATHQVELARQPLAAVNAEVREKLEAWVKGPEGPVRPIDAHIEGFEPREAARIGAMVKEFEKLTGGASGTDNVITFKPVPPGRPQNRSYYWPGDRTIYVDPQFEDKTLIHEMGHWFEDTPETHADVLNWLKYRTAGDKLEPLSEYNRHYGDDEVTKPDKFLDAYIGKDYGGEASEALSMAFQWMYTSGGRFYAADPDHFLFAMGSLFRAARAAKARAREAGAAA